MPLTAAALPLALAAVLLVGGCRRETHRFPDEVVENFMRACRLRGTEKSCRCALAGMEARYTPEEYAAVEASIRAGNKPPPEMIEIARSCGG
jgi:hypothetical protein